MELDGERLYKSYKPLLFSIAYRLLGSVVDAEDAVQEAFLAWNERGHGADVKSEKAFLSRIVVHKCADRIRALERQRETYVGPWLPEPLIEAAGTPEDASLRQETLHTAYLLLLQSLGAVERIVLVLREAFGFEYDEIAWIVGKSAVNCRQILSRARSRLSASRTWQAFAKTETEKRKDHAQRLATEFAGSLASGDVDRVIALLSPDATLIADGGGKVKAARYPVESSQRVAAFLFGVVSMMPQGAQFEMRVVNGLPGWVVTHQGVAIHVISMAIQGEQINGFFVVSNPDKLIHINLERHRQD